jgi:hypothetical protein
MISPTKLATGLIGVVDRPIDPIAESEFLSQPKGQWAYLQPIATCPECLHHRTAVVGITLPLDLGLETEAASEVGGLHAGEVNVTAALAAAKGNPPQQW